MNNEPSQDANKHTQVEGANIRTEDLWAVVVAAYRLGYQDRAAERDYDPGHALDLVYAPQPKNIPGA